MSSYITHTRLCVVTVCVVIAKLLIVVAWVKYSCSDTNVVSKFEVSSVKRTATPLRISFVLSSWAMNFSLFCLFRSGLRTKRWTALGDVRAFSFSTRKLAFNVSIRSDLNVTYALCNACFNENILDWCEFKRVFYFGLSGLQSPIETRTSKWSSMSMCSFSISCKSLKLYCQIIHYCWYVCIIHIILCIIYVSCVSSCAIGFIQFI